jgi:ceramide glucosyltransferase
VNGFQWIGIALSALALVGLAYQAFAWLQLELFFSPRPRGGGVGEGPVESDAPLADRPSPNPSPTRERDPGVTILKPLHGAEPRLKANLATFLAQNHLGPIQLVCGIQDRCDPARAAVEELQREYPAADIALVVDPARHGANAKVGNLINMMGAAQQDVIVLSDSDMAVTPDYLAALLRALAQPNVGAVTCFYAGRCDAGFWSRVSAGIVSHVALPDMVVGYTTGLARPCMGSTIAFTRNTFDAIGGFECFADVLADDHAIGAAVAELGLKVEIPPLVLTHACAEPSFAALWRQKLRWAATIRGLQPWGYAGSVVTRPLPLALLAALFVPQAGLALALAALAIRSAVVLKVDRIAATRSAPLWLIPLIDSVEFIVFAASFFTRKIDWRGSRLTMAGAGRITA